MADARAELGLGPTPSWTEVRVAYRAQIAAAHPDRAGGDARAGRGRQRRPTPRWSAPTGRPPAPPHRPRHPAPTAPVPRTAPVEPLERAARGARRRHHPPRASRPTRRSSGCSRPATASATSPTSTARAPSSRRSCGSTGEGVCSLVITLQGRADGTDAFCTLEAIEHVGVAPGAPRRRGPRGRPPPPADPRRQNWPD